MITVAGRNLRVATSQGSPGLLHLLVFNGLGADLDLMRGFAREIGKFGIGIVIFDVPGIGGSGVPLLPYRFSCLARLANEVLICLGIEGQVDVAGMSWGGALAQEFAHRYPARISRCQATEASRRKCIAVVPDPCEGASMLPSEDRNTSCEKRSLVS